MMMKKEMIAMLLAGGQGSRLGVLTEKVAKPAVAFGGKYRIIDFPLSNCINSGIDTCLLYTSGSDGMTSVHTFGVIQTFIVHTHINAKDVGKINGAVHASLVRADDSKMLIVNMKTLFVSEKSFDKLIGWLNSFKTMKRSCVLNTGVMGVKGNDVFHTHSGQLLKSLI